MTVDPLYLLIIRCFATEFTSSSWSWCAVHRCSTVSMHTNYGSLFEVKTTYCCGTHDRALTPIEGPLALHLWQKIFVTSFSSRPACHPLYPTQYCRYWITERDTLKMKQLQYRYTVIVIDDNTHHATSSWPTYTKRAKQSINKLIICLNRYCPKCLPHIRMFWKQLCSLS